MMPRPSINSISAFTLMELLVVLAIFGVLLLLTSGMSSRVRDTFIAQQQVKSFVQSTRIIRRKSMLVTRNANDNEWVHGIGIQFERALVNNESLWQVRQFKALRKVNTAYQFYVPFPTNPNIALVRCWAEPEKCETARDSITQTGTNLLLTQLENTATVTLPKGMELDIRYKLPTGNPIGNHCTNALTLIYEIVNGELHAFCSKEEGTSKIDTPDEVIINTLIKYASGANYKYIFNVSSSGEINAIPQE